MIKASDIVLLARDWLGTPFAHQGRSRHGVDCIGLPIAILREVNLLPADFKDIHDYGRQPDGRMEPIVTRHCQQIGVVKPGCLALVRWPQLKFSSHAAIITGHTMIHSYQRAGRVVEHGYRGVWTRYTSSLWALPGVSYE